MDKKQQIQKRLEEKRILKTKTAAELEKNYDDDKIVVEIPMARIKGINAQNNIIDGELKDLYIQLQKMHDTVGKALDKKDDNNEKLIAVNNSLVQLQTLLLDKGLKIKDVQNLEGTIKTAFDNLKDIKIPENLTIKNMPNWLASEKSLDQVNKNLAEISSQMAGLETTPQGQKADDYVPFRRVVAEGQRLRFDDSIPNSGGGGAGGSGITQVVGNVASGDTDTGNPVKVGGKYNTTSPTLTNGQRGDLQLDALGNLGTIQKNNLLQVEYDYVAVTYPTTTSELYTFKIGGSGGATVSEVTVEYTDTSKNNITSVART